MESRSMGFAVYAFVCAGVLKSSYKVLGASVSKYQLFLARKSVNTPCVIQVKNVALL